MNKRLLALAFLLLLCGCMTKSFLHPDKITYNNPGKDNLKYEDVYFNTEDGLKLHGWFLPAAGPSAKGTVIFFHGNACNITYNYQYIKWLPAESYNVFTFDYRGYGNSEGKPSISGTSRDAKAAMNYIKNRKDIAQDNLYVLAQSLGGNIALNILENNRYEGIKAAAIDSTFSSYRGIVKDKARAMPVVSWFRTPLSLVLIGNKYSAINKIGDVSPTPVLFIHGTKDSLVPYYHSALLYKAAREPKYFWTIPDGAHMDAFVSHGTTYQQKLLEYFDTGKTSNEYNSGDTILN
ncbi:MAG: hypothetical protein A2297_03820 [Elusimicrobia bacterium RIFOXYB2_FULL_48_7]|nr:MAG: hypothetical protein A2297_03820 [Elusimicrobia bacterium RIFOXYB2_FULL_48_7]